MAIPISVYALVAVFILSLFLGVLSFLFWRAERHDRTPLWLTFWLGLGALFVLCRLLQYTTMSDKAYMVTPRILLTASYCLAWVGYELANSFVLFHPAKWERALVVSSVLASITVLWTSNLILTNKIIIRTIALGGGFHGVTTGFLYLPFNLLILVVGAIAPARLLHAKGSHKRENVLMACGYFAVILFSLLDFLFTFLNLPFIRLSDYSYLPIAIIFSFNQVARFSQIFKDMDSEVIKRTTALRKSNELLTNEVFERKRVNEELDQITLQLKTLIEHVQTGILFENAERKILLANQAFCELFGIHQPASSLIGMNCKKAAQSSKALMTDQENFIRRIETIIREKHKVIGEELYLLDGRIFERDYVPIADNGRLLGHVWQYSDISERKHVENGLRESEKRFRSLYENTSIGIYRTTPEGNILLANPSIIRMLGYKTFEELAHRNLEKEGFVQEHERGRFKRLIESHGEVRGYESTWIRKDGTPIHVRESARAIKDQNGKVQYYEGTTEDITERKQAQSLQEAVYQIAIATETEESLDNLYSRIHQIISSVMPAENFYIMLYDEEMNLLHFPYFKDIKDEPYLDKLKPGKGLTAYVLKTGKSLLCTQKVHDELERKGAVQLLGEPSAIWLGVPLVVEGKTIGAMVVQHYTDPNAYTEREQHMLEFVSSQVAFAINRKQTEEKIHHQADEMTVLYETTHDLVEERNLPKLLNIIVKRATKLLSASACNLYLCYPDQSQARCVVSYNTPQNYNGLTFKYGEGVAGKVAETSEPLIVEDYRVWSGHVSFFEKDGIFISTLCVPMLWQDRTIGVIQILEKKVHKFKQDDLRLLTLYANQAAIAIENSRLLQLEKSHSKESDVLAEIGRDILTSLQFNIVLDRIASHAKNLLNAETSAIYLPEPNSSALRAIAAFGPDADQIKKDPVQMGEGILGDISLRKVGEIINNANMDPRSITIEGTENIRNEHLMGVPVTLENRLIGLIAVWRVGKGLEFTANEFNFLNRLSGQVAIAIESARLFKDEENRRRESETLREATEKITGTLDQEQAIQIILEQLAKVVSYESASLQLLGDGFLKVVGGRGWADPLQVLGMTFPVPGDNPNSQVILERRAIILGAAPEEFPLFRTPPHDHIQSWLGVPLIARGNVIGMLAVDHRQPDFFTDSDLKMVYAFAGQAAIAIENVRLFAQTRQRLVEIESVHSISVALRAAQTLSDALPIILDRLMDLFNGKGAALEIAKQDGEEIITELALGVWKNLTGLQAKLGEGITKEVMTTGHPYIRNKVETKETALKTNLFSGLSAIACVPVVAQELPIGALWIGRQDPIQEEDEKLLSSICEMVGATIRRMRLHEQTEHLLADLQLASRKLEKAYDITLEGWAKALELRDKETEGHSRRVSGLTIRLARHIGIPEPELIHIYRGVLLHDIGKMGVSDQLLRKSTKLTDDEWQVMKKHPQLAYDLLHPIIYLRPALDIPYCHHEKWDGTGYPRGLKGNQIPLAARVFAVVDVYDALLSSRPYRPAWSRKKALAFIREQSGKQFDPMVVDAFFKIIEKKKP